MTRKQHHYMYGGETGFARGVVSHSTSIPRQVKGNDGAENYIFFHIDANAASWFRPEDYGVAIEDNSYSASLKEVPFSSSVRLPSLHLGKWLKLVPHRPGLPAFSSDRLARGGTYIIREAAPIGGYIPLKKVGGMI